MKGHGWWHWPALGVGVAMIAALGLSLPHWRAEAQVLAGYAARSTCSCRYVADRSLESCTQDRGPVAGLWAVQISDDPAVPAVTATVPLLTTREARFAPGAGCHLDEIDPPARAETP